MALILVRTESIELLSRYHAWLSEAGHQPILTTSLAAAHHYLLGARRLNRLPAGLVTTMPGNEQVAEILNWNWLDLLRSSAAPAPTLLVARHPALWTSPRPGSVALGDPAMTERTFLGQVEDLLDWPVPIARQRPS